MYPLSTRDKYCGFRTFLTYQSLIYLLAANDLYHRLTDITEPQVFIAGQETAIVEFDDGLVRKLINQILVYLKPLTSNLITRGGHNFPWTSSL